MAILAIDDDQVLALVAQLPSERKVWLLRALASEQWPEWAKPVSYTHLRAHETVLDLVCRLLLEKKTKYI